MVDVATAAKRSPQRTVRTVEGVVNYTGPINERPRYYSFDHSRDVLSLAPTRITIEDARTRTEPPTLQREGFQLVRHASAVKDFRDADEVMRVHRTEIEELLAEATGADRVVVLGGGVVRFGERSPESGRHNNSTPARFVHVDVSDGDAGRMSKRIEPTDRPIRRFAHYNVWRALSPPPQDVPLALCAANTVAANDLVAADAIFDAPGQPEWSLEGWLLRPNPAHRWSFFSDMNRDEALIFTTNDQAPGAPHCVPHSAFDDASCPADVPPRTSIEMRGVAYWYS